MYGGGWFYRLFRFDLNFCFAVEPLQPSGGDQTGELKVVAKVG